MLAAAAVVAMQTVMAKQDMSVCACLQVLCSLMSQSQSVVVVVLADVVKEIRRERSSR